LQHQTRIRYGKAAPDAYKAIRDLQGYVDKLDFPKKLVELVKIRASQLNGCAYCLDMHTKDAIALGEDKQRIFLLDAWRETSLYSDRERAALEWTEAVTLISKDLVPQEVYERVRREFSEKELVELSMVIIAINAWNRLCIAFRHPQPGSYKAAV
jgi:AhpD family alkylhydroperoxidase